jgi:hypothetical protein
MNEVDPHNLPGDAPPPDAGLKVTAIAEAIAAVYGSFQASNLLMAAALSMASRCRAPSEASTWLHALADGYPEAFPGGRA